MTKVKKMLGMVMAALMCFALTPVAAFAAAQPMTGSGNVNSTKGEITITNAIPGQEYSIYEIFQLESYNNDAGAYSYKVVNDKWKAFLNTEDAKKYVEVSSLGYVTWVNDDAANNTEKPLNLDAAIAKFAELAIDYAKANNIEATDTKTAGTATNEDGTAKLVFEDLELGYYLVSSSMGTLCSLNTTNNKVDITDKNEKPSIEKEVQENSDESWGANNNANIGDIVNFRSTITGQPGALNYVFHDQMTKGLELIEDSIEIVHYYKDANGNVVSRTLVNGEEDDYAVVPFANLNELAGGSAFNVYFSQDFCNTIAAYDEIVVTYSALLNADAVISPDANINESRLSYGSEDTTVTTPPSTTKTYTGYMTVFKHNASNEGLAGAEFVLSRSADDTDISFNSFAFVQLPADDERADANVPTYRLATYNDEEGTRSIVTDANGRFKIVGLDEGTYYLHEITAPDGYNKLAGPQTVVITEGEESVVNFADADVLNQTGLQLPSTGGMGTTILYIVGGVLVVAAIAFLVVRRRNAVK